ncbi:MAG: tetratricopeptide repeat protein [Hamadaea sp.]|nr:tetratricopeptide repeat protein [Hamadaea sp.]
MPQPTHLPEVWAQARALRDRGDLASARMLLEDSLDSATFQYGEDHPDILATALLLATLHRRAGDPATARRVLEEALQAGSMRLDESEPVLLRISFELASVADALGNKHEARKHYGRVAAHGAGVEGLQDQVREAVAWLGPQSPPAPAQPAYAQPGMGQPIAGPPMLGQPGSGQPGIGQPGSGQPMPGQPHSPAPGVLAVPPPVQPGQVGQPGHPGQAGLPQRAPQDRPVMAGQAPQVALPERTEMLPAPVQHAPLPSLSGPVRYAQKPADESAALGPIAPPPVPVAQPSQIFTATPSVIVEKRGRGAMVAAVAAALVAVVAAGVVVVLMLNRGTDPAGPGPQTAESQSAGAQHGPATNLTISDRGDSITLRWTDPAGGSAGFAVKMGASRDAMKLVTGNLGAKPTFTITGLNAKFSYCFSVVTIYSGAEIYESNPVCTTRGSAKPS